MSRRASQRGSLRLVTGLVAMAPALLIAVSTAAAAPKPDLKVSEITPGSSTATVGATLSAEDTTKNSGAAKAGRSTTRFYLSEDDSRDAEDARLEGKRAVGPLKKGESSAGEAELGVPPDAPQGQAFLIACADDREKVAERREGNNCRTAGAPVTVELPADCTDALTALGIDYEAGPSAPGVADPVTVGPPVNGITYDSGAPGDEMFMDCTLGLALHAMGDEMAERGLTHVEHFGIYNYRCIGGGTPPDCPNGISRHAYADAFDIRELRDGDGETYNVEDDWEIDPVAEATCAAPTSDPKDAVLHSFVCALHAEGIFHIALTPNYNADHRNHFHLDLTPGASFID